ncbi:MAG TPA: hypothetical protein PKM73_01010 [Verrucomicrobiota bacterium]|nr:hypothetical protein [Verrucomicrobiota bacterium]HNU50426.1 hypothetical protein [Verrucomicrobiota bacterium]
MTALKVIAHTASPAMDLPMPRMPVPLPLPSESMSHNVTVLLWSLSIPFAGLLLLSLIFGPDPVIRALQNEGGTFLIPLLR